VFAVAHLNARNQVIEYVELFRGTVTQTPVYPREVVKEALARNGAAVLLVHTHPSGTVQPSRADEALTQTLKSNGGRAPRTSANVWYRQPPSLGGPKPTRSARL
jgi:DNA repair protein RadC